uniref:Cobalt transport protein n=1 Tax=Pyropia pulchra TaxID=60925 RepID=A0A141SFD2_9RHOD|nr:hypothetical protein Ppul_174 [Pyropia pulchra]AMK97000.1 hypothetical protein Ppul_174 [Pyropia pulchra]
MATFELIPYRLYLSQSRTWMHTMKAEIKLYILTMLWISIFIFSYYKLCIIALSLIAISLTIRSKQSIIQKHLLQTFLMTALTTCLSFSLTNSYKQYSPTKQLHHLSCLNKSKVFHSYQHTQKANICNIASKQLQLTLKPSLYFFITIHSIKLVMITTSPEILVVTAYKSRIINMLLNNELLFMFLLSSHIVTNIIRKLDKITQVASLRGRINFHKSSTRFLILSFLIFEVFFLEIIKESKEISQALYTRNLNEENSNFLKIYKARSNISDWLNAIIGTLYFIILGLA